MKNTFLKMTAMMLAIILVSLTSCSKYEDGPGFSLRTKKQRVVADWKATSFTINGQNGLNSSTSDILECFSGGMFSYTITGTMDIEWTFKKDGKSTILVEYGDYYNEK